MNIGIWGWDEVALPLLSQWRKIHVNAVGDVQVDVGSSALPLGAASAANQVITNASLAALEAAQGRCYGWDGAAWQTLMVDTAANKNLRVRLYYGGVAIGAASSAAAVAATGRALHILGMNYGWDGGVWEQILAATPSSDAVGVTDYLLGVLSHLHGFNGTSWDRLRCGAPADALATSGYALDTRCFLMGYNGTTWDMLRMQSDDYPNLRVVISHGDALAGVASISYDNRVTSEKALNASAFLMGFDGTYWDRLRTWGVGVLKTGRAEIDSTTVRHTAVGFVVLRACNLYWVACSPDSPSAEWELSDDTDGSTAAVYDHFDSDKHSEHLIFDPPMKFRNGIYIKKFDHMHSLVFCYV